MPIPPRSRALLVFPLALIGCRPQLAGTPSKAPVPTEAVRPVAVPDQAFSASVHKLLIEGKSSPDRMGMLAGVVSRQLAHAGERFAGGQEERGISSITGALFLVRAGELRPEMLSGAGPAFSSAISLVAQLGDEGRAGAFLTMQAAELPAGSPARRDNDEHIAALRAWMHDTRKSRSLEALGAEQRVLAMRSLVEPTTEALTAAREATINWIDQSLRMNEERKNGGMRLRREDALEAYRAFRSGAESLAALYLRHGDAAGALADLDQTSAGKIAPPSLYKRLQKAASGGDAAAWRELLAWLWNPDRRDSPAPLGADQDPELAVDPNLLKGAIFGTAVEAYRLDPRVADVDFGLATMLVQLGMPEAAPPVLADAALSHPEPAVLSGAFEIILRAILREDEAEDVATARRTYAAAEPLLSLGARPEWASKLRPTVAQLRLAMGTIETRAGNLTAARPLLESSASAEPSVQALLTLSSIDRQEGKNDAALARLSKALGTPEAKQNPLSAGEAHLSMSEIQKEMGAPDKAKASLLSALGATLDARKRADNPATKGHSERLLARVLFRFSDPAGAMRATERAFLAAGQDKRELAATTLEATQFAFLRRDVNAARAAVLRGMSAELPDDDLVYAALWLLFTERDAKARSDGTAARALSSIRDDGRWASRLAQWGLGRLKDGDLAKAARTIGQKTEASFYIALGKKTAGDKSADAALAEVAKSPAVDLVEVQLAKELLSGSSRYSSGPLPSGVTIP